VGGIQMLARLSLSYPKSILLLWALLLLFFGYQAPKLPTVLKDHGLLADESYVEVQQILSSDFHIPKDPIILVFEKKESVTSAQFHRFIQQALLELQGIVGLNEIVSPMDVPDMLKANAAYALIGSSYKTYEMKATLDEIRRRLPEHTAISIKLTGKAVVQEDVNQASQNDLRKAELIGIPFAFFILWFAFRGIVSAMIPIIIGVASVSITMGMMALLGTRLEVSNFVLNVIPMVGLALSIDFALMLVSRFREELERASAAQALVTTMKTAGRAVIFSAASVFLGLAGIMLIPLPLFATVALGAMAVLTVSVLATLTLLPALLMLLWPAIRSERMSHRSFEKPNFWSSLSKYVMNRPVQMGFLACLLLISCFLPLKNMKLAIPDGTSLPLGYDSRTAFESFQAHFDSPNYSQIYVIAVGKASYLNKEDWQNAHALIQHLAEDPYVIQVNSIFSALRMSPEQMHLLLQNPMLKHHAEPSLKRMVKANKMLIQITLNSGPASKQAMDWVKRLEQEGRKSELQFLVGGEAKYQQEVFDAIFENIPHVGFFIFVSNFIVLFAAFRSIIIPIKTILMNLLSLGAAFGILAWMFEEGGLGMEPGPIAIMIPVFIFGLVFGISMDYGVFLVSRIYEVYRLTHDNDLAVWVGLTSTSRVITSAAAIMIAVTAPFAWGEVVGVKQLGIGIAAAILIDATVIRMVLVPALMKLFGKWNWWALGWHK
jgi:RND superfamily putative drug exporter